MLTKNDLKQIGQVVHEQIQGEVPKIVSEQIQRQVPKIVSEQIQNEVPNIVNNQIKKELKPIKSDIAKIRKDINIIISAFDNSYVDLRKRVERIEEHLNLPTTN